MTTQKSITCQFTGARIVAHDETTVTVRSYGKNTTESRRYRSVQPTGRVNIFDRVTGEYVDWDVVTDDERKAGY